MDTDTFIWKCVGKLQLSVWHATASFHYARYAIAYMHVIHVLFIIIGWMDAASTIALEVWIVEN